MRGGGPMVGRRGPTQKRCSRRLPRSRAARFRQFGPHVPLQSTTSSPHSSTYWGRAGGPLSGRDRRPWGTQPRHLVFGGRPARG